MGLEQIQLYPLSNRIPCFSDPGKRFEDFFVSLRDLCSSVDMGEIVISDSISLTILVVSS